MRSALTMIVVSAFASGCNVPSTTVVLENAFPTTAKSPLVVYDAFWQAVEFTTPVPPGASSEPQPTVPASPNVAYVLLAPGWDPASKTAPASYIVLESRDGFEVQLGDDLDIPVDDATFAGDCAEGSQLSQREADFLTEIVFPAELGSRSYDAATCTMTGGE